MVERLQLQTGGGQVGAVGFWVRREELWAILASRVVVLASRVELEGARVVVEEGLGLLGLGRQKQ